MIPLTCGCEYRDKYEYFIETGLIDKNYLEIEERMRARGKFIPFLNKEIVELHSYMDSRIGHEKKS